MEPAPTGGPSAAPDVPPGTPIGHEGTAEGREARANGDQVNDGRNEASMVTEGPSDAQPPPIISNGTPIIASTKTTGLFARTGYPAEDTFSPGSAYSQGGPFSSTAPLSPLGPFGDNPVLADPPLLGGPGLPVGGGLGSSVQVGSDLDPANHNGSANREPAPPTGPPIDIQPPPPTRAPTDEWTPPTSAPISDQPPPPTGLPVDFRPPEQPVARAFVPPPPSSSSTLSVPPPPPSGSLVSKLPPPPSGAAVRMPPSAGTDVAAPVYTPPTNTAPVDTAPTNTAPVYTPPVQVAPVYTPPVQAPPVQAPRVQAPPVQNLPTPPVAVAPVSAVFAAPLTPDYTFSPLGSIVQSVPEQLTGLEQATRLDDAIQLGQALVANLRHVVLGTPGAITAVAVAALCGGHLLIEDVPGVGKTVLAQALAASLGSDLSRIQGHPDLLPSDVTGVSVFSPDTGTWDFKPGPVFAHVVLVDELNRTPPRTQAALLETMEEQQVSADGQSWPLPIPHLVIATQNPHSQLGTYPLVESQLDRFALATAIGYPDADVETQIVLQHGGRPALPDLRPVCTPEQWLAAQLATQTVVVEEQVAAYAVALCRGSRSVSGVRLGASPRAAIWLVRTAQAHAVLAGRAFVTPGDV
jgi:MoxR-like ATPase